MIHAGLPPDVGAFTAVINVCAHSGDVAGAEKWFSAMHLAGIWPGAIAYNSVINAHAQAKDRAGAERWFEAMEASGTVPNEVSSTDRPLSVYNF
jgi:pentatricopeptide repeat protein